jgi:hypothetical protein
MRELFYKGELTYKIVAKLREKGEKKLESLTGETAQVELINLKNMYSISQNSLHEATEKVCQNDT